MKTPVRSFCAFVIMTMAAVAHAQDVNANTDRWGMDYSSAVVGIASQCQAACQNDAVCTAWTFNKLNHNCWLKTAYSPPSSNPDATSGIIRGRYETGDRMGAELIRKMGITSLDHCRAACEADPSCRQFTFDTAAASSRPWNAPQDNCWLHSGFGDPYRPADTWTVEVVPFKDDPDPNCEPWCHFSDHVTYEQHLISGIAGLTWCIPSTCGSQCGTVNDGCGGTLNCGPCTCKCTGRCGECGGKCDGTCTGKGGFCSDGPPFQCLR